MFSRMSTTTESSALCKVDKIFIFGLLDFIHYSTTTLELVDGSQMYVMIGSYRKKHLYIETAVQKDFSQKSIFAREITFEK